MRKICLPESQPASLAGPPEGPSKSLQKIAGPEPKMAVAPGIYFMLKEGIKHLSNVHRQQGGFVGTQSSRCRTRTGCLMTPFWNAWLRPSLSCVGPLTPLPLRARTPGKPALHARRCLVQTRTFSMGRPKEEVLKSGRQLQDGAVAYGQRSPHWPLHDLCENRCTCHST